MKTLLHPVAPGLQAIETDLALDAEPSAAPATHAAPDTPLPLTPTVGDATTQSVIIGTGGNDLLFGTDGDDTIYGGGGGSNVIRGGAGNDEIHGYVNNNLLTGGDGNDILRIDDNGLPGSNNTLQGEAGDDFLVAGTGDNNRLEGGDGNDFITVNGGNN